MSEHIQQLSNGLTVAVEPMVSTRAVSIGVWVGVGARHETPEQAGMSHFLEHLLFKGTPTRSAIEISQTVDRFGGDINAFTSKEYTAYYCRLPARYARVGIELVGDVLTHPALRDADIDSERQVILEELAMDDDSPEDVVHRAFAELVFGEHALGRDTAGDRASVSGLVAEDVRSFYRDRYRTENTVVSVAGAVDVDDAIVQIEAAFSDLTVGNGRVEPSPPGPAVGGQSRHVADDTEQAHIVLGGRGLARLDPDRDALDIANHVLGGGLSSRLFDEIRERRGLAYSVFSSAASFSDSGTWSVYAGTFPEHAEQVCGLIRSEVDRLVADGITADELAIAQGYLSGGYELGLEDSGARMSRLGGQLVLLGEVRSVESQLERWAAVTEDDVRQVAARVYGAAEPVTTVVGPI